MLWTPKLAVIFTDLFSDMITSSSIALRIVSAILQALSKFAPGRQIKNSSPPYLATQLLSLLTLSERTTEKSFKTRSPTECPYA